MADPHNGYNHKNTNEKVVGVGVRPPKPVPSNILVRPLRSPPMIPIKDAAARPGYEEVAELGDRNPPDVAA